jgi:hypothetical protein
LNTQAHGCAGKSDKPQQRLALVRPSAVAWLFDAASLLLQDGFSAFKGEDHSHPRPDKNPIWLS